MNKKSNKCDVVSKNCLIFAAQSYNNFSNNRRNWLKKPENITVRLRTPKIKQSNMKRYFKNLWHAFIGKNPFHDELTRVKEEFDVLKSKVSDLSNLYYEASSKIQVSEQQIRDYQQLVENLRRRLADKDDVIKALQSAMTKKE